MIFVRLKISELKRISNYKVWTFIELW